MADTSNTPLPLEPEDFYLDGDGLLVFTRAYHLKRGHCCKSGCRHCPWSYRKPAAAAPEGTTTAGSDASSK